MMVTCDRLYSWGQGSLEEPIPCRDGNVLLIDACVYLYM